ncbi:hypothetical protein GYMLUDRAFT_40585 [Collybiopsis luxurians FD-317 M1]|uniref:Uncharacterized protein n=1 Tax=Collybiopsis luxurians FD-317 M1 TaxID=944289 RepID=A0A0D0CV95_9AGAR|nr:hypothetical protein GYMLUDRAFT_40585 [Collybiopsis luxurians FD-317 M1]
MEGISVPLPPELKHHIAALCGPGTLVNLAIVDKSYRDEAERVLYTKIFIEFSWRRGSKSTIWDKLNDTLRQNLHKASLVRSLTVLFKHDSILAPPFVTDSFCTTLTNLHGLVNLCLHLHYRDENLQAKVQTILRYASRPFPRQWEIQDGPIFLFSQGYLRLETFHCSQYFDFSAIADAQSNSLRILGSYGGKDNLRSFQSIAQRHPELMLFSHVRENYVGTLHNILSVYPALYPDKSFPWKAIVESSHDENSAYPGSFFSRSVDWVHIYLADICDVQFLRCVVEGMVELFPNVTALDLKCLRTPERAYFQHIPPIISTIPRLRELSLNRVFLDQSSGSVLSQNHRLELVKAWSTSNWRGRCTMARGNLDNIEIYGVVRSLRTPYTFVIFHALPRNFICSYC